MVQKRKSRNVFWHVINISNLQSITADEPDLTGAVCIKDGREILRPGDKLEPSPVSPPDNGVLARDCGLSRSSSDDVDQSEWISCGE